MTKPRPQKLVVAALVISGDRILLTKRPAGGLHPGEWEFPGGKIEPGEAPTEALQRELREEVDLEVELGLIWEVLFHAYDDFDVTLLIYAARPAKGAAARCLEVADIRWVSLDELASHPVLPADQILVDRLVAEGIPTYHFDRGR